MAGGFTEFASRSRVVVIRSGSGVTLRIPFDYDKVRAGDRASGQLPAAPGRHHRRSLKDPMKLTALRFLVCPTCKDALELQARVEEGPEVMEGQLRSPGCGREYAITARRAALRGGRSLCLQLRLPVGPLPEGPDSTPSTAAGSPEGAADDHGLDGGGLSGPPRPRRGRRGGPLGRGGGRERRGGGRQST